MKKPYEDRKIRMCDPGMCDHCIYIGEGDFICDRKPDEQIIVVADWQQTDQYLKCKKGRNEKWRRSI